MTVKTVRIQVVIAVQPNGVWQAMGEPDLDVDWHVRALSDGAKPGTQFHYAWIRLPIPSDPTAKEARGLTLDT